MKYLATFTASNGKSNTINGDNKFCTLALIQYYALEDQYSDEDYIARWIVHDINGKVVFAGYYNNTDGVRYSVFNYNNL